MKSLIKYLWITSVVTCLFLIGWIFKIIFMLPDYDIGDIKFTLFLAVSFYIQKTVLETVEN